MATFDGDTENDRKLWNTYLYWARESAMEGLDSAPVPDVLVDNPANRVASSIGKALQVILFSCFALEYRLKRVLFCMNVSFPERETMGPFLRQFWSRLQNASRLDGHGNCSEPSRWNDIRSHLERLVKIRNDIAHANYIETLNFLTSGTDPIQEARLYYNYVIEAIRLINEGTGYDIRSSEELDEYFRPLKL